MHKRKLQNKKTFNWQLYTQVLMLVAYKPITIAYFYSVHHVSIKTCDNADTTLQLTYRRATIGLRINSFNPYSSEKNNFSWQLDFFYFENETH